MNFPSKLARPLRSHAGSLFLNGVQQLSEPAAAHIARHRGDLHFDGLFELSPEAAKYLAGHRSGLLSLGGLLTLEEATATALTRHRGRVCLSGLRLISPKTRRILESSTMIQLPSDLQDRGVVKLPETRFSLPRSTQSDTARDEIAIGRSRPWRKAMGVEAVASLN